jgi:hypothetical protein
MPKNMEIWLAGAFGMMRGILSGFTRTAFSP